MTAALLATQRDLQAHEQFAMSCITKAFERFRTHTEAPWEDALTTAAMWMVARQDSLAALTEVA